MRAAACALAIGLAVGAALAAPDESITVAHSRTIEPERLPAVPHATHELRLTAHTFRNGRWDLDMIEHALVATARLLAQCDVALTHAEVRRIDAPERFRYYRTPDSRALLRAIVAPRPALFFVDDTRNDPAFDAEAIGLSNSRGRPELANTMWVAHGARDLAHAITHELVHVLSDSGEHSTEAANLMRAQTAPGNERLTAGQCERLRLRGEANGLLRRRSP